MNRSVSLPLLSRVVHPQKVLSEDGGRPALLIPSTICTLSKIIPLPVLADKDDNSGKPNFVIRRFPNGAVKITRPLD